MPLPTMLMRAAAGAAMLTVTTATPLLAADTTQREATIMVSGTGQDSLRPDIAIISLGVTTMADNAGKALADNAVSMNKVLEGLKKSGIEERDLQTSGLSISPQYTYPDRNGDGQSDAPELVGYQVNNQLSIRLRDVTKVGETLDKTVELGVNQAAGISFANTETKAATTEARKRAVKDAMAKAQAMADAAGVKLGRIIEMSESQSQPMPIMLSADMAMKSAAPTPVAVGENSIQVTVSMVFAIQQ